MSKRKSTPVTIAAIHAHGIYRAGLVALVEKLGDCTIVLQVADLEEYIARCAGTSLAAIALVDLGQPGTQGEETIRWIREHQPGVRPIAISPYDDDTHILHAVHAGACGYLDHHSSGPEMRIAIDQVRSTGHCQTDRMHACMLAHPDGLSTEERNRARLEKQLKGRRIQVLRLLCSLENPTNARIARRMHLKPRTVEAYLHDLFALFGVACRSELALAAVRLGLVQV